MKNATTAAIAPAYTVQCADVWLTVQATIKALRVPFPNSEDSRQHNKFKVTVKSSNGEKATFDFFDSQSNYNKGIQELDSAALKGALSCFVSDATTGINATNVEDLMSEFGWNVDSRKEYQRATRIYKACVKASEKLELLGITPDEQFELANLLDQ
ncbi:hypothetical protein [Hymenobacter glacieicola]|uniref:Uncharacterized protein n=1 Tax=Hymenobacter glacieicola TaxID=1562124 RepID=A0ABQ1X5W0_9BACT|nr:hypothetical protein [Hymenobacter glacieicola]GGG60999.1 hypothetical protein GCM10011378_41270 [Hymenobacter glacieicola]